MEDIYNINKMNLPFVSSPQNLNVNVSSYTPPTTTSELHLGLVRAVSNNNYHHQPDLIGSDISDRIIKNQIATHPLYPNLLSAFIECQKVRYLLLIHSISFNSSLHAVFDLKGWSTDWTCVSSRRNRPWKPSHKCSPSDRRWSWPWSIHGI